MVKTKLKEIISKSNIVSNAQRQECLALAILSMIIIKKVQLSELATVLNNDVAEASNEQRLYRFFRDVDFNYEELAKILTSQFPYEKVTLVLDRTEWDFGKTQVNILCLTASFAGFCIPIYFDFLDNKSGNSCSEDRIDLIKKAVKLFGISRTRTIIGDREFVGNEWFSWLKTQQINFCMRIKKNFNIIFDETIHKAEALLAQQEEVFFFNVEVLEVVGNVAIKKDGKGELLILFGTEKPKKLFGIYRKRWGIETFFQSIKKRGFNLEDTHIDKLDRLKKLFSVVCLSYCFCVGIGIAYHRKVQFMKKQKDGYKRNSFFRKGLDIIRNGIKIENGKKPSKNKYNFNPLNFLNLFLNQILAKKTTKHIDNQLVTKL